MTISYELTSLEIQEIGEALYGKIWQGKVAKAIGVPRQSIVYYLNSGGVNHTQASAIVGLVARVAARELRDGVERQDATNVRRSELAALLLRFDPA
ncbi:MAG: hypothetical protein WCI21_05010 [Alphaproteobacteria bacterium]